MENQGNVSATGTVRIELYALTSLELQQLPTALELGEAVPLAAANARVRLVRPARRPESRSEVPCRALWLTRPRNSKRPRSTCLFC